MYFGLTIVMLFESRLVINNAKSMFILSVIPFLYGVLMEFLQSWLTETRHAEFLDAFFDLLGILLALGIWKLIGRFIIKKTA